jgi:hypothetical protein
MTEDQADILGCVAAIALAAVAWALVHPSYPLWAGLLFMTGVAYAGSGTGTLAHRWVRYLNARRAYLARRN